MFVSFQLDRVLRFLLLPLLLLQALQHVWLAADSRVLRLHSPRLLRILLDARRRQLLRLTQVYSLHLRQHQDGLIAPDLTYSAQALSRPRLS